ALLMAVLASLAGRVGGLIRSLFARGFKMSHRQRLISQIATVAFCLELIACGSLQVTQGPSSGESRPARVAVLDFTSDLADFPGAAADGCVVGLMQTGVRAIERQRVQAVLNEKQESR